jgi:hypothetical protein
MIVILLGQIDLLSCCRGRRHDDDDCDRMGPIGEAPTIPFRSHVEQRSASSTASASPARAFPSMIHFFLTVRSRKAARGSPLESEPVVTVV